MEETKKGEDRVRDVTPDAINKQIDQEMWQKIREISQRGKAAVSMRIEELEREWDIERYLAINMSTLALGGLAAGYRNKSWLALPAVVLGFFVQHTIQGWCPPLPLMRYLKLRTRKEIEKEKYALKVLRGDFDRMLEESSSNAKSINSLQQALKK